MSTSAINAGVSTLLESLGKQSPVFSSPAVQAALKNASPEDTVRLSEAALEAQTAAGLFSSPGNSTTSLFDPASILSNLVNSATQNADSSQSATQTPPLQNVLAAVEGQKVAALLNSGTTIG